MKSWEVNKSIRKSWGRNPSEQVHRTAAEKGRQRQNLRKELEGELDAAKEEAIQERFNRMGKKQTAMRKLKREKGTSVIPRGDYCYDAKGNCQYWDVIKGKPRQCNGFCWFLEEGDWEDDTLGLLWDQVKSCPHNQSGDDETTGEDKNE